MNDFDDKFEWFKEKAGEAYENVSTAADVIVMGAAVVPIYLAYKAGAGAVKGVKIFGNWLKNP